MAVSCIKEAAQESPALRDGKQVTIKVSMPEDAFTKVDFTADADKLALSWHGDESIRVISGSESAVFTLSRLISAHEAEFTGPDLAGTSFDILIPGTYASVDEAVADADMPAQNGNATTGHLRYKALLSGVDSYQQVCFTPDWASSHGGTLKQGAAVKLQVTLPDGVTDLKEAALQLGGETYSLPLTSVDVSASEHMLTAFMMLPWEDIPLPSGSQIPIFVTDTADEVYGTAVTLPSAKTILGGRMNTIKGVSLTLSDFVAGDGTQENPFLIANTRQLRNMMQLYADAAAPADKSAFKKWFRLLKDVDASSINPWRPLNCDGSYYKAVDFDGGGHTLSGLTANSTYNYASFAGVLYGTVHDVTFSGAVIAGGSRKCGVVAGFLGTDGLPGSCENVIVTGATVTSTNYAGGFAGHVRSVGHITGCSVENSTVTTTGYAGGFTAYADLGSGDKYDVPCIFTDCHVSDVTVNQNYATAAEWYTGGFVGYAGQASTFIDCTVKATITADKAAIKDVGGFIGRDSYAGSNFRGCRVLSGTTVTSKGNHSGGFIGYAEVAASFNDCSSEADVNNGSGEYTGGFVGYAAGASVYQNCYAKGDVSGQKHVGGFVGTAENAMFTDCHYADGTVTDIISGQAQSAGFCGYPKVGVSFSGCYVADATLTFTSAQRVGGFIGQMGDNSTKGNTNILVSQCYVSGTTITGALNCGGFVGVQYDNISHCYVYGGTVNARGNNCGGFAGFTDTANLIHCFSTASVAGGSYSPVGGFAGIVNKSDISYCYSAGSVSGSGAATGAFAGKIAVATASFSDCIGWHASLPFYGATTTGATVTDCYAGNSGTVSSQAVSQTWPTAVWNLEGTLPVLLDVPRRIRAAFIGDSITWQWARNENTFATSKLKIPVDASYMTVSGDNVTVKFHPGFFSGNGYVDKGISGQNTTQMRARFQKDVVALNPVVAVIMGGTNDLAQGVAKETIIDNISAMAAMAKDAGIQVVLCSVTPNNDSYSKLSDPKTKGAHIIALNTLIQSLATSGGYTYCNYWSSLVADDGLACKTDYLLYDNLHPGPAGYTVMEGIIKPIIDGLL